MEKSMAVSSEVSFVGVGANDVVEEMEEFLIRSSFDLGMERSSRPPDEVLEATAAATAASDDDDLE